MSVDRIGQGLQTLSELLGQPEHDPDPQRTDWAEHEDTLDEVEALVDQQLLEPFEAAMAEIDEGADELRSVVADRIGDASALLLAAGRRAQARQRLQRASELGKGRKEGELCVAGLGDPERFTQLIRAWWLVGQQRRDEARTAAQGVLEGAPTAIADSARSILDAPRPIDSPPGLGTLNGFGFSVYGERDRHPNGTYVKTRFLTALFVPLLPLDAYRVADGEDGGWYFLGKVPLTPLHAWWRKLLAVGLVLAVLGWGLSSYFDSEGYRLKQAIAAAQEAEEDAGPDGRAAVIDRYEAVLNEFPDGDPDTLQPVIEAFVRLSADEIGSPMTLEHLGDARRLVHRYQSLPDVARRPLRATSMIALLERWAEELGTDDHSQILAAIELLGQAEALADGSNEHIVEQRRALGRELAGRLAIDWPLEAIRQYVSLGDDPPSIRAAATLIEGLGPGPSVWIELGPTIDRWASKASKYPEFDDARAGAMALLSDARERAEDPERQALLAGTDDEDALASAVDAHPGDQELAVALAYLRMGHGDAEGAQALLDALGSPGHMVMGAQVALASIRFERGQKVEADALLERVLSNRLPAFETARRLFIERNDKLTERFIEQGQKGRLPAELLTKLERASEAKQLELFREWVDGQLAKDHELTRLRDDYASLSGVIDVAIQWGTIKLRRAQGTTGDERQALLDGAERAFLAIASDGQGVPSYHLGLGQVYYRLGREDEAEREFGNLLDDDPPGVQIAVARTYRDLGLVERAKEIATSVYEHSESPAKESAAALMALTVSDFDERRSWLERSGDSPVVKRELLSLEGDELQLKGELAAADQKYARVVAEWSKETTTNPAAANNAAVALFSRFTCTGDLDRLREAVVLLEQSRSRQPDSAVVLGNLASAVESVATAEMLDQWVRTPLLLLDASEIDELVAMLSTGPMGARVRGTIAKNPSMRRALELSHQEQVLAPRRLDAHVRLLQWYARLRDGKHLAQLAQVVREATLEKSRETDSYQRYIDGDFDQDRLEQIESRLRHFEARLPIVQRKRHAPTLAALHATRGELLLTKAMLTKDARYARDAAKAFALADEHWPELGTRRSQSGALVQAALLEAATSSVAMREAYDTYRRRFGTMALLAWLLEDDGDALAALRTQPGLAEAAALRREAQTDVLTLSDWILANVARDEALLTASRPVLERSGVRDRVEIDLMISPFPEGAQVLLRQLQG